jgi:hypothetical protein
MRLSEENESYYMGSHKGLIDDNIPNPRIQMEPGAIANSSVSGDRPNALEKIRMNGITPPQP